MWIEYIEINYKKGLQICKKFHTKWLRLRCLASQKPLSVKRGGDSVPKTVMDEVI